MTRVPRHLEITVDDYLCNIYKILFFRQPFFKITVPTIDTVRYQYIVSALLAESYPVLLTGPVGTGKTSTAQSVLSGLDPSRYTVLNVNLSAQVNEIYNKYILLDTDV